MARTRKATGRKPPAKSARTAGKSTDKGSGRGGGSRTPLSGGRKPRPGRPQPRRPVLRHVLKWAFVAGLWAVVALAGLLSWYAYDLPDIDAALAVTRQPAVTVTDRSGRIVASYGDLYGEAVRVDELPPQLPQAVIAIEDRRFYEHFGIDPIGIMRAAVANLMAGRIVQGGSTITQQVAKNLFLTPERSLKRKVQELLLAFWLEHRFTKDQILGIYLNRVYLGAGVYGVDAAARRYFGRPAERVSLWQAAVIAGLPKAPSRYNPLASPKLAAERARQVLAAMRASGFVNEADVAEARPEAAVAAGRPGRNVRYFADWVMAQVASFVGPPKGDLTVVTTLDATFQRAAETELAQVLEGPGTARRVGQGAFVAMTPDGAVRAMVGGRDWRASQFNRAVQALRQPGSAFKPLVYLAAVQRGLRPDDMLVDRPITVDGWTPDNLRGDYRGEVTAREAMARSINTVAVEVMQRAGRARVESVARRLGITAELHPGPALALGASEVSLLELTAAYAPFANGGYGAWPYGILEIRDGDGRLLYRRRGSGPGRVADAADVALMNDMLNAVVRWGTGRAAAVEGHPAAGKTGTSQNFRDAWFVGYTAHLVGGVWLGNDDGTPMEGVSGSGLPAKLWGDAMAVGHRGLAPKPLPGLDRGFAQRPEASQP
ncbi:MAG: PBP1A family penicillin-binding protein [Acetobacterales bacterium]